MKIKLLLLCLLMPMLSFGANTNEWDNVFIKKTLRYTNATVSVGKFLISDASGFWNGTFNGGTLTNLTATNLVSGPIPTSLYGPEVFLTNRNNSAAANTTNTFSFLTATNQIKAVGGIRGVPGAAAAAAGNIGEYFEVAIAQAGGVALTTVTPKTVMSLTLTAGNWIINGQAEFNPAAATTFREIQAGWSTTTNSVATFPQTARIDMGFPVGYSLGGYASAQSVPTYRFTCSTTTNLYFNFYADFATSTMTAYGFMTARRSANAQ